METAVIQQTITWLKKYGLPALWLISLPFLVWGGFTPAPNTPENTGYPFGGVLLFAGITLLEVGLLYLILRPPTFHNAWGRFAFALFVFTPLSIVAQMFQDVPGYFYSHALWLGSVLRLLIIGLVFSLIAWIHERRQKQEDSR